MARKKGERERNGPLNKVEEKREWEIVRIQKKKYL